jgi:hypothetical protein
MSTKQLSPAMSGALIDMGLLVVAVLAAYAALRLLIWWSDR